MLKNYFIVAARTLHRQKGYAAINIVGLAVGLACCVFLLLFVRDELSYDRFHEDADAIFRVNLFEDDRLVALTPTIVAPLLTRELPEVVAATRVETSSGLIRVDEDVYDERGFYYADSTFFDVFTFPLLLGDVSDALKRPNTVILTRSMAEKYFGRLDVLGERITRNNAPEFEITGVMEDLPANSHIQFNFLASFASREYWASREMWGSANFFTYIRLGDASSLETVEQKIALLLDRVRASGAEPRNLTLQSMTAIHLSSGIEYELDESGDMAYVKGFFTLAMLILLMACVNYMNLATARSVLRAREVGMRKSLGALRSQLIGQFYGEALIMTLAAVCLGVALVVAGMGWFNGLAGKELEPSVFLTPGAVLVALAGAAIVSLIAGSYPALFLSSIEPVRALRGRVRSTQGSALMRRGLVVVQFGVSAFLIVGALVVVSQLRYMQDRSYGFDKEHVVEVPINDPALYRSYPALREAAAESPALVAVSALNQIPGQLGWTSSFRREGSPDTDEVSVKGMPADAGVPGALGIELIAGRSFPEAPPQPDSSNYLFIINETAARILGWTPDEAVGQRIAVPPRRGEVVGVAKDFNFNSLHVAIEPLAIWYQPREIRHVIARFQPGQTEEAIDHLESVWARFAPGVPFTYRFIDDVYDRQYANERRTSRVVAVFAFLAILVACLGLLGLASFTAQSRTREIGVRKVLGASVPGIVGLLSKDFVVLVAVAFAVAVPVAWLVLSRWLSGFAYHIELGPGVFAVALAALMTVAFLTSSTQALRAATTDPVKSLRYD